jgi:hypothetical protein
LEAREERQLRNAVPMLLVMKISSGCSRLLKSRFPESAFWLVMGM